MSEWCSPDLQRSLLRDVSREGNTGGFNVYSLKLLSPPLSVPCRHSSASARVSTQHFCGASAPARPRHRLRPRGVHVSRKNQHWLRRASCLTTKYPGLMDRAKRSVCF